MRVLDKSVPYVDLVLERPAGPLGPPRLPEGYALRLYRPGDEAHWARVEAAVGEFGDEAEAAEYFTRRYLPLPEEVARRFVFAVAPDGTPVGNAAVWRERDVNVLHWLGVAPEHGGKGLGSALVRAVVRVAAELSPGEPMFLHTQTWSWRAVGIYAANGFRVARECPKGLHGNPDGALPVLREKMRPELFELLTR